MIPNESALRFVLTLLGGAFVAGGFAWQARRSRSDLNGLGRKYSRIVALMVRWADSDEKRRQVADLIEGK